MCRLFGVIANKPVDIEFSFFKADTPFKEFSKRNPDGWGIGWYENGKPKVLKEAFSNNKEYDFDKVKTIKSRIIISHVRLATRGSKNYENTHPFVYENFIFAHNGSVDRENILTHLKPEFKEKIKGETDSEAYFMLIMQFMSETKNIIDSIQKAVKIVKESTYSGLNFIMTDGNSLYAFRDAKLNEDYYSLYYLERNPSNYSSFEYMSEETKQMIRSKLLLGERAVLISSERLTKGENWKALELGELIIVDHNLKIERKKIQ